MDTQFFNKINHYKVITDVIQYKKRSKIPINLKINIKISLLKIMSWFMNRPDILLFLNTIQQKCWKTFIKEVKMS